MPSDASSSSAVPAKTAVFEAGANPLPDEAEHLASIDLGPSLGRWPAKLSYSWRASRYSLKVKRDGALEVVIPEDGTAAEGRAFLQRHAAWVARTLEKLGRKEPTAQFWTPGVRLMWRGRMETLEQVEAGGSLGQALLFSLKGHDATLKCYRLGQDRFELRSPDPGNLREPLEHAFEQLAKVEVFGRAWELATLAGVPVKRVVVRAQRSRWGSCSARGTISLNWRLLLTPDFVRDYVIYHEFAHLRQMNHSERFWREVERLCPNWREAEAWLKENAQLTGI